MLIKYIMLSFMLTGAFLGVSCTRIEEAQVVDVNQVEFDDSDLKALFSSSDYDHMIEAIPNIMKLIKSKLGDSEVVSRIESNLNSLNSFAQILDSKKPKFPADEVSNFIQKSEEFLTELKAALKGSDADFKEIIANAKAAINAKNSAFVAFDDEYNILAYKFSPPANDYEYEAISLFIDTCVTKINAHLTSPIDPTAVKDSFTVILAELEKPVPSLDTTKMDPYNGAISTLIGTIKSGFNLNKITKIKADSLKNILEQQYEAIRLVIEKAFSAAHDADTKAESASTCVATDCLPQIRDAVDAAIVAETEELAAKAISSVVYSRKAEGAAVNARTQAANLAESVAAKHLALAKAAYVAVNVALSKKPTPDVTEAASKLVDLRAEAASAKSAADLLDRPNAVVGAARAKADEAAQELAKAELEIAANGDAVKVEKLAAVNAVTKMENAQALIANAVKDMKDSEQAIINKTVLAGDYLAKIQLIIKNAKLLVLEITAAVQSIAAVKIIDPTLNISDLEGKVTDAKNAAKAAFKAVVENGATVVARDLAEKAKQKNEEVESAKAKIDKYISPGPFEQEGAKLVLIAANKSANHIKALYSKLLPYYDEVKSFATSTDALETDAKDKVNVTKQYADDAKGYVDSATNLFKLAKDAYDVHVAAIEVLAISEAIDSGDKAKKAANVAHTKVEEFGKIALELAQKDALVAAIGAAADAFNVAQSSVNGADTRIRTIRTKSYSKKLTADKAEDVMGDANRILTKARNDFKKNVDTLAQKFVDLSNAAADIATGEENEAGKKNKTLSELTLAAGKANKAPDEVQLIVDAFAAFVQALPKMPAELRELKAKQTIAKSHWQEARSSADQVKYKLALLMMPTVSKAAETAKNDAKKALTEAGPLSSIAIIVKLSADEILDEVDYRKEKIKEALLAVETANTSIISAKKIFADALLPPYNMKAEYFNVAQENLKNAEETFNLANKELEANFSALRKKLFEIAKDTVTSAQHDSGNIIRANQKVLKIKAAFDEFKVAGAKLGEWQD